MSFLFSRTTEKECEDTFGKHSPRCQKPVSAQALPIALGVCIPVCCAIFVCCYLQWRHIKRLKKEDDETKEFNADIDMDEMDQRRLKKSDEKASEHNNQAQKVNRISAWGMTRPPQYPSSRTASMSSSNNPENPFHSSEIYLLHPDKTSSHTSLEEYSKSIYDGNAYPSIRSANAYPPSMRGSQYSRSSPETNMTRGRHQLQQEITPTNVAKERASVLSSQSTVNTHQTDENAYEDARDHDDESLASQFQSGSISRDQGSFSELSYASGASHLDHGETSISTPTSSSLSATNYPNQKYSVAEGKSQDLTFTEPQSYDDSRVDMDDTDEIEDELEDDDASIQQSISSRSGTPELSKQERNSGDYSRNLTDTALHGSPVEPWSEEVSTTVEEPENTDKREESENREVHREIREDHAIDPDVSLDGAPSSPDVSRSDTKHFERVKSFYREYMDVGPEEGMLNDATGISSFSKGHEDSSYDENDHLAGPFIDRTPSSQSLGSPNYARGYDSNSYYDNDGAESYYGGQDDYDQLSVAPSRHVGRPYSEYTGHPMPSRQNMSPSAHSGMRQTNSYGSQPVSPISTSRPAPPPPRPLPVLKSLPSPSNLGDGDMVNFAPKVRRKPKTQSPGSPGSPQLGSLSSSGANMVDLVPEKGEMTGKRAIQARPDSMLVPGTDDSQMLRPRMSIR